MTNWSRDEIEMAFIREFQTLDNHLARPGSSFDKHERVRIAIMKNNRSVVIFHDSNLTYAQAFRVWSGKSCEMRAAPRDVPLPARPIDWNDELDDEVEDHDAGRAP